MPDNLPSPKVFEIEPDWAEAHQLWTGTAKPRRRRSGTSARRKEHVRPDRSDREAYVVWEATPAPTNAARVSEELERWFGARCKLCGEPIDMTIAGYHPARWNVDHTLPRSKGGKHTWGNLQLAHKGCNAQKSNLELPEPPPWLYSDLLRAAIDSYENGFHVESEIEQIRYRATYRIAIWASSRRKVEEGLIDDNDFFYLRQESRALSDIALVTRIQERLISEHGRQDERN